MKNTETLPHHSFKNPGLPTRRQPLVSLALLLFVLALLSEGAFAVPGKPAPKSVEGSTTVKPSFRFSKINVATYYRLRISDLADTIHYQWYRASNLKTQGGDSVIKIDTNLKAGKYRWWVQAYNSTGVGSWSSPSDFEIQDPSVDPPVEVEIFESLLWVDPLALTPGTPNVEISLDPLAGGEDFGASGLIVKAVEGEGSRRIEVGLSVPPGMLVKGARVCYEVTNASTFIDEIRILQLQDPPSTDMLLFQDETDLTSTEPVCVDSAEAVEPIDPSAGSLRLQLILSFPEDATPDDCIVIHGLGLHVASDPEGPLHSLILKVAALEQELKNHTHEYLTGRGNGHNNKSATTSPPTGN
jgi:hypothetical protein